MYAIDVTQKVANLRSGRIADSILTDKNLAFKENQKCIPAERKNTVIAAADQDKIDNMVERLKNQGMSEPQAMKAAKLAEQNQLAEVIAKTISQPSQLNIFATRLPSANASVSPLVQAFELSQFQADLKKLGYDQWAARVGATIGYVQRTKAW
jgi:hypothetical protein